MDCVLSHLMNLRQLLGRYIIKYKFIAIYDEIIYNFFYEYMYIRPDKTIIKSCLQALLEQLYWSHLPVVTVAADCLITFAHNSSLWSENDGVCHLFIIIH